MGSLDRTRGPDGTQGPEGTQGPDGTQSDGTQSEHVVQKELRAQMKFGAQTSNCLGKALAGQAQVGRGPRLELGDRTPEHWAPGQGTGWASGPAVLQLWPRSIKPLSFCGHTKRSYARS